MKDALAFQDLDVYVVARELAVVIHRAKISDAELRDQAGRASKSLGGSLVVILSLWTLRVRRSFKGPKVSLEMFQQS